MVWSQFLIWFDLRKQLTQKQRLIRTFDVGGSGIKTVAWHDRQDAHGQGKYVWVSIKLKFAGTVAMQYKRINGYS